MTIILTRKGDGSKLLVNVNQVKFFEPDEVSGTHLVFGADLVRQVVETIDQIKAAIGTVVLP